MTDVVLQPTPVSVPDAPVSRGDRPAFTYIFTGGGTGGHVYPGLSIADEIRAGNPNAQIVYIGARGRIEATLVPRRGYPIHLISAQSMPWHFSLLPMLQFMLRTGIGVLESLLLLLRIRPDMVVATGGYASSPVLLALWLLRRLRLSSARCFVHEQNVVPGKANRLAGYIADRVGVSFAESLTFFPSGKAVRVGYPVRREIGAVARAVARAELGIPDTDRVVFVFGGSQGARSINRAVVDALPTLLASPNVRVIHVTGQTKNAEYDAEMDTRTRMEPLSLSQECLSRYHLYGYAHEIERFYAASDIVIGRAGAATVTEICACGLPSILIPLPYAPGDHQALNARTLENGGAGLVVYEETAIIDDRIVSTVDGIRLAARIFDILDHPDRRASMSTRATALFDRNGATRIAEEIDRLQQDLPPDVSDSGPLADAPEGRHATIAQLSPFRLVQRFSKKKDEAFIRLVGEDYLKYRVDGYLKNETWTIRNEGVKLAGLLGYTDRLAFILGLLRDKTPTSRLQRLFGGDYRQVGFIRRNAVHTLRQLDQYSPEVRQVLLETLKDPYFEVRTASARTIAAFADRIGQDEEMVKNIRVLIADPALEVSVEAIKTSGKIGDISYMDDLRKFYLHPNWLLRDAVIQALTDLVRRNRIPDLVSLREDIHRMMITCNHFEPFFPIKRTLSDLETLIRQKGSASPVS
ncbi:MAG: glycosyltransferase [candidate division Zixibacteria bacterium]|nr:glycosyltransferase [candidate division Zixibacteria bacterium]